MGRVCTQVVISAQFARALRSCSGAQVVIVLVLRSCCGRAQVAVITSYSARDRTPLAIRSCSRRVRDQVSLVLRTSVVVSCVAATLLPMS